MPAISISISSAPCQPFLPTAGGWRDARTETPLVLR
jgi:hypothetical protein